jgi:lipoprotein-anchoring transpeptidase ErfK/SrfK
MRTRKALAATAIGLMSALTPLAMAQPAAAQGVSCGQGQLKGGLIAWAKGKKVNVYQSAGGKYIRSYNNPNKERYNAPLTFLVVENPNNGWLRVMVPSRPNMAQGWILASDVELRQTGQHVVVSLSQRTLCLFDGDTPILTTRVAVGAKKTPTPTGIFFMQSLLNTGSPSGSYGPYAFGTTAFSNVLFKFGSKGDGQVGIHGTNHPELMGQAVSNGCIRVPNENIRKLASTVPLGTPVEIVA